MKIYFTSITSNFRISLYSYNMCVCVSMFIPHHFHCAKKYQITHSMVLHHGTPLPTHTCTTSTTTTYANHIDPHFPYLYFALFHTLWVVLWCCCCWNKIRAKMRNTKKLSVFVHGEDKRRCGGKKSVHKQHTLSSLRGGGAQYWFKDIEAVNENRM